MSSQLASLGGAVAMIAFGALEGYVFARCGVVVPSMVKDQMSFKSMGVMKMFLGAVGSSMVAQSVMDLCCPSALQRTRHHSTKSLPAAVVAIGTCILGTGMYMSGSGPTMMPTQLAMGIATAPFILAGAFAGATAFALTKKFLPVRAVTQVPSVALDRHWGMRYASLAAPAGIGMIAMSWGLEKMMPSSSDNARIVLSGVQGAITPTLAGCVLGLNQIPLRLISGSGQGGSTAVSRIIATITGGKLHPDLRIKDLKGSFNVLYVYVGTFVGALAAHSGGFALHPGGSSGTDKRNAFIGAFLMLYGARLAGGCTCGHGVTGVSELVTTSILGASCIFGAGMAAAVVHNSL